MNKPTKNTGGAPKRMPLYYYFINLDSAYRAPVRISKAQKALGLFSIAKPPEVFSPTGWTESQRFSGLEGAESFQNNIEAGIMKKVSMISACTHVDGDIVIFAPTLSGRIASKKA